MNNFSTVKTPKYPWYQVSKLKDLEQGDLFPNCPIICLPSDLKPLLNAKENDEIDITPDLQRVNLILMTQSCDLAHQKVEQVLLCAYSPFAADVYRTCLQLSKVVTV